MGNKLIEYLQDLASLNTKGAIYIEDYPLFMDAVNSYQNEVLHSLSQDYDPIILKDVVDSTRLIFDLRATPFIDEEVPEILWNIFQANLSTLEKVYMREGIEKELEAKAKNEGDKADHFTRLVNASLDDIISGVESKEEEELKKQAVHTAEALSLGCDPTALRKTFESGEEKLLRILNDIHQEQVDLERKKQQDLSLFEETKSLVNYQERRRADLEKTLNVVASSVIRNNSRERLMSQGFKIRKKREE